MSAPDRSRVPPLPFWHGGGRGFCRWCGQAVERPDGTINLRRRWHHDCYREYLIATQSDAQRTVAWNQANGVCQGCGLDLACNLVPREGRYLDVGRRIQFNIIQSWAGGPKADWDGIPVDGPCYEIMWRQRQWQADHIVPLWSVDKSAPDALRFWGAENLQLLCESCHKAKSAREAAMRAKEDRQRKKLGADRGAVRNRPKRRIPSRPLRKRSAVLSTT